MKDNERVKAKFAELFTTSDRVQIPYTDFFGIEARYNETVGMYYEFLKYLKQSKKYKNVDFSATHRI